MPGRLAAMSISRPAILLAAAIPQKAMLSVWMQHPTACLLPASQGSMPHIAYAIPSSATARVASTQ